MQDYSCLIRVAHFRICVAGCAVVDSPTTIPRAKLSKVKMNQKTERMTRKDLVKDGGNISASYLSVELHELYLADSKNRLYLCESCNSLAAARASDYASPHI